MESVKELETGTLFTLKGEQQTLYGTLVILSADNLAAHMIGGYKSLHASFRKCQFCMATSETMSLQFTADHFVPRTRETHALHCQDLTDFFTTTYGVARDSILNESVYFHVTEGIPPDIMHDFLKGPCSMK
jgi:hypothetical protein